MFLGEGYRLRTDDGAQYQRNPKKAPYRAEPVFRHKHPEEAASISQFEPADNPSDAFPKRQVTRNQRAGTSVRRRLWSPGRCRASVFCCRTPFRAAAEVFTAAGA